MTAGALIMLKQGNAGRMAFLTFNPQVSYFKSVYKKHTNFSMDYRTLIPEKTSNLSHDVDTTINFKIKRDCDLINDMYFTFDLPDVYSRTTLNFQWIRRLGEYIVKDITLRAGGLTLDKQYSEWFHIWSELNLSKEEKESYNKLIGNTVDMYDPANVNGHSSYPVSEIYPSIQGRKIYLPLRFWFNNNISNSFPLIATQNVELELDIILRPLQELYTIVDTNRKRPSTAAHKFGKFLKDADTSDSLNINPQLEINNIFLDNEERKRFALVTHEYLGKQVQRLEQQVTKSEVNNVSIDLKNINKPITQLYILIRRSDFETYNLWSNFTNWLDLDTPYYADSASDPFRTKATISSSTINFFKNQNLLKSARLNIENNYLLDGNVRNNSNLQIIDGKDDRFFNLIQPYTRNNGYGGEGIYVYSFSIDNTVNAPKGACNMSNINNKKIEMVLNDIYNSESFDYNYNVYIYAENYEIFKIMGGLVGTVSAN